MIDRLETLHTARLIHRDIKPENVLMGVGDKRDIVYLIDFGLSKGYINR
jgi:serine/threonine protein kinase